jgi:hypothetical protein
MKTRSYPASVPRPVPARAGSTELKPSRASSQSTRRWREPDSNHRSLSGIVTDPSRWCGNRRRASKWPFLYGGTDGSNPVPSSGERTPPSRDRVRCRGCGVTSLLCASASKPMRACPPWLGSCSRPRPRNMRYRIPRRSHCNETQAERRSLGDEFTLPSQLRARGDPANGRIHATYDVLSARNSDGIRRRLSKGRITGGVNCISLDLT